VNLEPEQYSKQGNLQFSYSCKIQALPGTVVVVGVCCDVLWRLVQFILSY